MQGPWPEVFAVPNCRAPSCEHAAIAFCMTDFTRNNTVCWLPLDPCKSKHKQATQYSKPLKEMFSQPKHQADNLSDPWKDLYTNWDVPGADGVLAVWILLAALLGRCVCTSATRSSALQSGSAHSSEAGLAFEADDATANQRTVASTALVLLHGSSKMQ